MLYIYGWVFICAYVLCGHMCIYVVSAYGCIDIVCGGGVMGYGLCVCIFVRVVWLVLTCEWCVIFLGLAVVVWACMCVCVV